MTRPLWTFHAACLRDGTTKAPEGPHEVLLVMRDAFDLLGPEPGQVLRLLPGAVLYAEVNEASAERLAAHLDGVRSDSGFRFGLGLMLGLDQRSDEIEAAIDDWIDAHVAVALLPVVVAYGEPLPAGRYDGILNGFADTSET